MANDSPSPTVEVPGVELVREFQYLTEDQKIIKIMDMLKNISFGQLTIKKHKGKISAFNYDGEILFRLDDYDKNRTRVKT